MTRRDTAGTIGELTGLAQLAFLLSQGLKRNHYLLDVGCGPLRAGKHFIMYLDEGHYFGIDPHQPSLNKGIKLFLQPNGLTIKKPNISCNSGQDFRLDQKFNFAIAHSVFTHLNDKNIEFMLNNVGNHLVVGGNFYASFLEGSKSKERRSTQDPKHPFIWSYRNKNPYHQPLDFYKKILPANLELVTIHRDWYPYWHPWKTIRGGMLQFRRK